MTLLLAWLPTSFDLLVTIYVDVWERDSRTLRAGLVVKQSQTVVVEATKKNEL